MKINIKQPGAKGNPSKRCYYYEFTIRKERHRGIMPEARNYAQAKQAAEKRWDDVFNERFNPQPEPTQPEPLFVDFVNGTYLPLQQTNKLRSLPRVRQIAGIICAFFAGQTLKAIKKSDVERFKHARSESLTRYERKRSPATVNRELAVLSAILTHAVDDELIPSNPCRRVRAMRADNTRERYLSADEEKKLLAALDGKQWLKSIVVAAIHTGMRRGELFDLRWFDVDFGRGLINVRNTKTAKDRAVPMNETVRALLEGQPKTSAYVFPSPKTGGRLVSIKYKFDEARTTAGIADFRFHDLRHTAATRLADAGVNVIVIAEILGHGDIRTTRRYSHAMDEAKRAAVATLAPKGTARQKRAKKQERQAGRLAVQSKTR